MNNFLDFIEYALIEERGAHIFGIFGNIALAANIVVSIL